MRETGMEKKNRLLRGIGFLFEGKNTSKIDDDNFCTTLLSILESIQLYTFFFFFFFWPYPQHVEVPRARDQTQATAVTWAIAVTMLDP